MKKAIKCGWLFQAKDESVVENAVIVIDGNRIEAVLQAGTPVPADAEVIDLSNKFVMPGMIEGHAHICYDGGLDMRPVMLYQGMGEITIRSLKNARNDLLAGFTTLRDECSMGYTDVDIRNLINSGELWGPRMLVSGQCISATGGHADIIYRPGVGAVTFAEQSGSYIINGPVEAMKAARTVIKYGADVVKLMATGGVLSNDANPGASDMTYEEMKAACDIAKMHGKISSAHAHGAEGVKNAIRAGITSIEHGMMMDDEAIDMLTEHGTYYIPTIIAGYRVAEIGKNGGMDPLNVRKAETCLERVGQNLHRMRKVGTKVGFGTDVGSAGDPHGTQAFEFELMMNYGGFSAAEVLLSATKVNSEMLGWGDRLGSIESGKFADIIAFNESPLNNIAALRSCDFVMKDGVIYKENGTAKFAAME